MWQDEYGQQNADNLEDIASNTAHEADESSDMKNDIERVGDNTDDIATDTSNTYDELSDHKNDIERVQQDTGQILQDIPASTETITGQVSHVQAEAEFTNQQGKSRNEILERLEELGKKTEEHEKLSLEALRNILAKEEAIASGDAKGHDSTAREEAEQRTADLAAEDEESESGPRTTTASGKGNHETLGNAYGEEERINPNTGEVEVWNKGLRRWENKEEALAQKEKRENYVSEDYQQRAAEYQREQEEKEREKYEDIVKRQMRALNINARYLPVPYTNLTFPTNREEYITVVAVMLK